MWSKRSGGKQSQFSNLKDIESTLRAADSISPNAAAHAKISCMCCITASHADVKGRGVHKQKHRWQSHAGMVQSTLATAASLHHAEIEGQLGL